MKYLIILLCFVSSFATAQTKLVVNTSTNKAIYVGQPPWAGQDTLTNYTIYDIGNQLVPSPVTDYFYINGSFVFDNSDSIQAANTLNTIKAAFQAMVGKTFSELTATQKTNMIEAIMWRAAIVNRQRKIRPLDQWLFKQ